MNLGYWYKVCAKAEGWEIRQLQFMYRWASELVGKDWCEYSNVEEPTESEFVWATSILAEYRKLCGAILSRPEV